MYGTGDVHRFQEKKKKKKKKKKKDKDKEIKCLLHTWDTVSANPNAKKHHGAR